MFVFKRRRFPVEIILHPKAIRRVLRDGRPSVDVMHRTLKYLNNIIEGFMHLGNMTAGDSSSSNEASARA